MIEYDKEIPEGHYIIVDCDGKNFSDLASDYGIKFPYNKSCHSAMTKTVEDFMEKVLHCGMAFVFSDEVSFILPKNFSKYNRNSIKIISNFSSRLTSLGVDKFYSVLDDVVPFVGNVYSTDEFSEVISYLANKKTNCFKNFVFTKAREFMLKRDKTPEEVSKELNGVKLRKIIDYLFANSIDIYEFAYWKRDGAIIYFKKDVYTKKVGTFGSRKEEKRSKRVLDKIPGFEFNNKNSRKIKEIINSEYTGD